MNDHSDQRAQQLAELEAAPELPLPDAALRAIEAWLPELRSQRAAQLAGPTDAKIAGANN